jgi:hypothetical protein
MAAMCIARATNMVEVVECTRNPDFAALAAEYVDELQQKASL